MRAAIVLAGLLTIAGCSSNTQSGEPAASASAPAPSAELRRDTPAAAAGPRIVFLGDSLTAGLGLASDRSDPSLIARRLRERGYDYEVVNAGVSGDTSAGGLRRAEWSLQGDVRVLVLALGANDGLRGLPPAELKANLAAVIERATARGITVILAGMEAPPNFGADYTRDFREVYAALAREHTVRFLPFLLNGVAGIPSLNQPDGIHPNARGAEMVADLVWAELEPVLERRTTREP
jgi:acyl-CoA thioesterase-1